MWAAWLADTITGTLGPQIPLLHSGKVDTPLNGVESWSVTLPNGWLRHVDKRWWTPWRASILIGHVSDLLPEVTAWCFGPITDPPSTDRIALDGTAQAVDTLTGAGLREILKHRIYTGGVDYTGDVDKVKAAIGQFEGMSLGTIQSLLVEAATQRRGGRLPVSFAMSQRETGLGDKGRQRTYEGFNVANCDIDKLISEISNVKDGPDLMLRPRLVVDIGEHVVCDVVHGTSRSTNIPQARQLVWDTTAPAGPINSLKIVSDAGSVVNRIWATGAGEGQGIAMQVRESDALLQQGYPLLEAVHTSQSTTRLETLAEHAAGQLASRSAPTVQVELSVQADHPSSLVGAWHVGDRVQLITPEHPALPAGQHLMTIISASVDLTSETVAIHLQ